MGLASAPSILPFLTLLLMVALLHLAGGWWLSLIGGRRFALCWLSCAIAFWLFPVFAAVITGRGSEAFAALGVLIHLPVLFSIISWTILFGMALVARYRKSE